MSAKPIGGGILLVIGWCCCLHLVDATRTHREHKVHNIVLYPDKHSWCKTTPIKQVVAWPGCVAREIDNNVCVGACFSYTIPQTQPSAPGDVISPYCDSCQPSEVSWMELTLECMNEEEPVESLAPEPATTPQPNSSLSTNSSSPPILMQKRVQVITNCSCSACHAHAHHAPAASDSPPEAADAVHHQPLMQDVPELMGLMREVHTRRMAANSSNSVTKHHHHHLHHATGTHLPPPAYPELAVNEDAEDKKPVDVVSSTSETTPHALPVIVTEDTGMPFEPPVPLLPHSETHNHHGHLHHGHSHHHGHLHHTPPAQLEVPQEKLQPVQEGAEMSYHDNLVPSDQSQEKDEEF